MSAFTIQLTNGCLASDVDMENRNSFEILQGVGAIEEVDGLWKFNSLYRAGRLYMGKDGRGFVEASSPEQRDLLVEPENLGDAKVDDIVVAYSLLTSRRFWQYGATQYPNP